MRAVFTTLCLFALASCKVPPVNSSAVKGDGPEGSGTNDPTSPSASPAPAPALPATRSCYCRINAFYDRSDGWVYDCSNATNSCVEQCYDPEQPLLSTGPNGSGTSLTCATRGEIRDVQTSNCANFHPRADQ